MDNLTHTLYGLALARTGLHRTTPRATLTLLVGANLPDVDFISIFWGDAPGDALGIGMFISILGCGEACGFGDAVGICIPGMFICVGGDDDGEGLA